jgi:uncharacterized coiled-coil DUF342 family protein
MELTRVISVIKESKQPLLTAIFELSQASFEIDSLKRDVKLASENRELSFKECYALQCKINELDKEISVLKGQNKKLAEAAKQ